MLKKLRLDQTNDYELVLATKKVAEMLVEYIQGNRHYLSIGSEQGGILKWDDFVVEKSEDVFEHIQVKRQQSDFSNDGCIRDAFIKGNTPGSLKRLSPLDESMKSLANWVEVRDSSTMLRNFAVEVPDNTTNIKKDLPLSKLHQLCQVDITPSTTIAGLKKLQEDDSNTLNLFNWLTTWCGFKDWEHILKALRILEIRQSGNVNDIQTQTKSLLQRCFDHVDEVYQEIRTYINVNTSYTSAITPWPLYAHLHKHLSPHIATWTQYQKHNRSWLISGIHDTITSSFENPSNVVSAFWNSSRKCDLRVDVPIQDSNSKLSMALLRLALHLSGSSNAYFKNVSEWQENVKNKIGQTLGLTNGDCDSLNVLNCSDLNKTSNSRTIEDLNKQEDEGEKLIAQMHRITWQRVCAYLENKIDQMSASELRQELDTRWNLWKAELIADEIEQIRLFKTMLHPKAEGEDILAELRVGCKTVELLGHGIKLLLVVSIALNKVNNGWKDLGNRLTVQTNALGYWSGPSGKVRRARKLTEDGITDLIGKEPAKILILAKVESSPTDVYAESLAYDSSELASMASSHKPSLLVTNSPKIDRLIRRGNISAVSDYLKNELTETIQSKKLS